MVVAVPKLPAHKPFTFDTVFEGGRVIEPVRPKTAFALHEVEQARAEAEATGRADALVLAEQRQAAALEEIARNVRAALDALARVAHEHRAASADLALACGRSVAGAALERFPEAAATAAFESLAREVEAQPRLAVKVAPQDLERTRDALEGIAARIGHPGRLVVSAEPAFEPAAFSFDWGDGRCAFDPAAAAARLQATLAEALAAEGLHAEPPPLLPFADAALERPA